MSISVIQKESFSGALLIFHQQILICLKRIKDHSVPLCQSCFPSLLLWSCTRPSPGSALELPVLHWFYITSPITVGQRAAKQGCSRCIAAVKVRRCLSPFLFGCSYFDQSTPVIPVISTQLNFEGHFRSMSRKIKKDKLARPLNYSPSRQFCRKQNLTLCLHPAAKQLVSLMLYGTFYTLAKERNSSHLKDWGRFQ